MHGLTAALRAFLEHYGYGAVFLTILMESFGVPLPGETILITGALEAANGRLRIVPLLLFAWLAAVIGDNIGYAIGRFGGRRLALRYGRFVRLTPERLQETETRFRRLGPFVVVFARFVEVLRQLNGILAGIAGMHWLRFLLFNAIGGALWVGFWGTLFYRVGRHSRQIVRLFKRYELPALAILALAVAGFLLLRWLRRRRRGRGEA